MSLPIEYSCEITFFPFLFWKSIFNLKSRIFFLIVYYIKLLHYGDLSQFFKNRVAYLLVLYIYHQAKKKFTFVLACNVYTIYHIVSFGALL